MPQCQFPDCGTPFTVKKCDGCKKHFCTALAHLHNHNCKEICGACSRDSVVVQKCAACAKVLCHECSIPHNKYNHTSCGACGKPGVRCSCGKSYCSHHLLRHQNSGACGQTCIVCHGTAAAPCPKCSHFLCIKHHNHIDSPHCAQPRCPTTATSSCRLCGQIHCAPHARDHAHAHAPDDVKQCVHCDALTALSCDRCHEPLCRRHKSSASHDCVNRGQCSVLTCRERTPFKCTTCKTFVCDDHRDEAAHPCGRCAFVLGASSRPCTNPAVAQCAKCNRWFCCKRAKIGKEKSHLGAHGCDLAVIEQLQAVGRFPIWTFQYAGGHLQLPRLVEPPDEDDDDFEPMLRSEYIHGMMRIIGAPPPAALQEMVTNLFGSTLGASSPNDLLAMLLALKEAKHWHELYDAFRSSPQMKFACCQMLNSQILHVKDVLHVHKRDLFSMPWIEEADTKPWEIRLVKKFTRLTDRGETPLLQVKRCHVIDVGKSGLLGATEELIAVRKALNAVHAKHPDRTIHHATILNWPFCSVLAINQKDSSGKGTTRIVTPCVGATDARWQVRVLDLSYNEIWQGLARFSPQDQQIIARVLIGLVEGEMPSLDVQRQVVPLTGVKARFLRGVRLDQSTSALQFSEKWWLSNYAKKIDVKLSMMEFLCSMAAILFVAEPRHARAMIPVTLIQLQEVVDGELTMADLFGDLGGGIEYGRLLAGANYIGDKLRQASDQGQWLTQACTTWASIKDRIPPGHNLVVRSCPLKDLRMVLADSPGYEVTAPAPFLYHGASLAVGYTSAARAPVYQVLMKELFTMFLRTLTEMKQSLRLNLPAAPVPTRHVQVPALLPSDIEDVALGEAEAAFDEDISSLDP